MADIKDKVVTVESLEALHEHNEHTYMTKTNPSGSGTMRFEGDAHFSEDIYIGESVTSDGARVLKSTDTLTIEQGGTGSNLGTTGLANLFASGATVLSSYQYGDELPEAGTVGRIFFKRLTDI